LLDRIGDFFGRDLKRKQLSIRKYGGWRPSPNLLRDLVSPPPTEVLPTVPVRNMTAPTPHQNLEDDYSTLDSDTNLAEEESQEIRTHLACLRSTWVRISPALGQEFGTSIAIPFGFYSIERMG
jgi:hypothetical protein